ncbi:MAG: NAD-dependent epimerase/dehydratase family protein [Bacillota bacterium]
MKKILVTGCNGFVGSHLCEALVERGHRVYGVDSSPYLWRDGYPSLAEKGKMEYMEGDITEEEFVVDTVRFVKPEVVFHLASVVGVNLYIDDPMRVIEVNILGLRNLLMALRGSGARMVFSSTSEIYGKNPAVPWREDADRVLGPTEVSRWSYSSSKAAAEHMLWACAGPYGIEAVVTRYFNLYGPRQRADLLIPAQIRRALAGEEMLVYDGGNQTRCFTFIDDAVLGTLAAAFTPAAAGSAFNIGSMVETTVGDVTRLVGEIAGGGRYRIKGIQTEDLYGGCYQDIPRRAPDAGRAEEILNWRATTILREGLKKTVDWWREFASPVMEEQPK